MSPVGEHGLIGMNDISIACPLITEAEEVR
jgi:hypothetical protein